MAGRRLQRFRAGAGGERRDDSGYAENNSVFHVSFDPERKIIQSRGRLIDALAEGHHACGLLPDAWYGRGRAKYIDRLFEVAKSGHEAIAILTMKNSVGISIAI